MRMGTFKTIAVAAAVGMMLSTAPASAWAIPADQAVGYDGTPSVRMTNDASVADEAAGADESASDSIPDNPTQALPDKVDESIPDSATLVSPDLAVTKSGVVKDVTTGEKVTDPELVGTKRQQPDPLAKTDGESFIPVSVGETKDQIEGKASDAQDSAASAEAAAPTAKTAAYAQSARTAKSARPTIRTAVLENNEYGAYWGTYSGRPAFFEADGTLFAQDAKGVVDVSEWQGDIDWQAAKNAGVQGAIIRIGYGWGNGFDATALRNIRECQRLGIPFGVYLYSYAYDNATASAEGQNVVNLLHEAGISPGDLGYPVYYDLERWTWTGYAPPTDPAVYDGIVNTWYSRLQDAGFTNLSVYSYTSYLYGPLNTDGIHAKTRWVASYGARTGFVFSTNDRGWQYTSGGSVPGIEGRVDLNAFGRANVNTTGKWVVKNGAKYWYENGKMATSKEIYDADSDAWYWLDADGKMARNKDVYQRSNGGKWVRYDNNGHMIKGEDYRYGGWYYFDPITGAMAKGMQYVTSNGGKWVYYDWITGKMRYGQVHVNYDKAHTGWYMFDKVTGAMFHGFTYIKSDDKWVYYDDVTGIMAKGYVKVNGAWYYFDKNTGKMAHGVTWVPEQKKWLYFDPVTGRHGGAGEYVSWRSASGQSQPTLSKYPSLSLEVRLSDQVVLVNSNGKTIYAMIASTGTGNTTAKGSFTTKDSGKSFYDKSRKQGGKFWIGLNKGDVRFQSVPTDAKGNYIESEARKLGSAAGNGNIRLTVADAEWLFNQLPKGTPVRIV